MNFTEYKSTQLFSYSWFLTILEHSLVSVLAQNILCDSSKGFVFQIIYCLQLSSSSITYVDLRVKPLCSFRKAAIFLPFICLGFPDVSTSPCSNTLISPPHPAFYFQWGSYCKVYCCEFIAQSFFCTKSLTVRVLWGQRQIISFYCSSARESGFYPPKVFTCFSERSAFVKMS